MERNVKFSYSGIDKNKIFGVVRSVLSKEIGNGPVRKMFSNGVNLIFVSKKKMAELNKKYRGKSKPTNVLSFETGDVVICPAVVLEEAKKYGFTQKKWMTSLIVHGILHLVGYDHEAHKDRLEMERLEKVVLGKLGIKNV